MSLVTWDLLAWTLDAAVVGLFYHAYRKATRSALDIEAAPEFDIGEQLWAALEETDSRTLPYACVSGKVEPVDTLLSSHYRDHKGVIQELTLVEHRTKRTQGYWTDATRVLRSTVNLAPFKLTGANHGGSEVYITEPLSAERVMDSLSTTFDKFEQNKSGAVEKGIDRIFGDVCKGFQETEKMLDVGVRLYGIGKLVLDGETIKMVPPEDNQSYILTKLSKNEVIKALHGDARVMKMLSIAFGALGLGLFIFWAYRKYAAYKKHQTMERTLAEFRALRSQAAQEGSEGGESENNCVVCLSSPKEVVMLDCGHICTCADCADVLPEPKKCPICRQVIARIMPVYIA